MKRILLIVGFLCFTFQIVFSQEEISEIDSLSNKASEYLENYRFDKALDIYSDLYLKDSLNLSLLAKIGSCNYKLGRYSKAKKAYSALVDKDSLNTSALNQLGVIYNKEQNYNKALDSYVRLVNIDSTNSYYYRMLGSMHYKCNNILGAIASYETCLSYNKENLSVVADLSGIYTQLKDYERADTMLSVGLEQDSCNLRLLRSKARLKFATKKYDELLKVAEKIVYLRQDTNLYMVNLMGIANFRLKNYAESIEFMEKMIDAGQDTDMIHYYLGIAYRNEKKIDSSIEHFEKAIELGESKYMATFYTNLGISKEEKGTYMESIKAFQTAYKKSESKVLLYHLARNYDLYYKDKNTALTYYESYISSNDSVNVTLNGYSKHRISQLKEIMHFQTDSL